MLLDLARSRRVLFIGGKGGVGKTATASAVGLLRARQGAQVLVVSTDPAHNLGHLWERQVGDRITALWTGQDGAENDGGRLDGVEIDPEATTADHLAEVGQTLRAMMPDHLQSEVDKHLQLAAQSPGIHESAVLERIATLLQDQLEGYDLIVFDTAPSGHTARLMALPEIMTAWTSALLDRRSKAERFGAAVRALDSDDAPDGSSQAARDRRIRSVLTRRRARFEAMREVLADPLHCSFVIVLTPERLPVLESVQLHAQLQESGVDVGALVVNRVSPADAGDFLARRRDREQVHCQELSRLIPGTPIDLLPLLPEDLVGRQALELLGEHLS